MALKLLKIQVNLEVKADSSDEESLRETVYDALQMLLESEDLSYVVEQDEDEEVEDES